MGQSLALRVSVVVLYAISFVASLVGNTLVLYITYKKPYCRITMSYLFVNLAVADLIVTVVAMPDSVAYYFRDDKWLAGGEGDFVCRIVHFSFALAIAASIFTLAAMTLDRFIAVVYPLRASNTHAPKTSTVVIWVSSTMLMFHRLVTFSTAENDNCKTDWSVFRIDNDTGSMITFILYLVFLFISPLILMAVLYSVVYTKLHQHQRPGIADLDTVRRRQDRNRKIVKLLLSIVVVFILCWVPVQTMHLLWMLKKNPAPYVMFVCFWCGHSHSAINPWMYMYLSTQFHRAFLEIIGKAPNMTVRNDAMKPHSVLHDAPAKRSRYVAPAGKTAAVETAL